MSHPLLVFSTLFPCLFYRSQSVTSLRVEAIALPPAEPRHNPDIHLGQIKQQHFSVAVGCELG